MAANTNARFYRLSTLPDFAADGKHVGLFVYVPEYTLDNAWTQGYSAENWDGQYSINTPAVTITSDTKVNGGLWFGGQLGWEHLTNVGSGISWQEIYDWFDTHVAGEAEIFSAATLTGTGETGTEITIFDPVLDRTTGLHASTVSSDEHKFTVGDGALKISGKGATDATGTIPTTATETDVHSANDVLDSTLTLDDSLVWTPSTPSGSVGTIGVRTKTLVADNNLIVTEQDIAELNGAMHLVGTLSAQDEWPDQSTSIWYTTPTPTSQTQETKIKAGDTFIVTGTAPHTGPDGVTYEIGDTVFYYESGGNLVYKVVNTNITSGVQHGQHAPVDMSGSSLAAGKLVIATNAGIATSNLSVSDFIKDIETAQEIENETASAEYSNIGVTYTVTTTTTKPDGPDADSDSEIETDTHSFTLHSSNNSLTIQKDSTNDEQINFDLVWLTTMV